MACPLNKWHTDIDRIRSEMFFKRILILAGILQIFCGISHAQLSSDRQRLIESREPGDSRPSVSDVERVNQYSTPPIYSEQETVFDEAPTGSAPPADQSGKSLSNQDGSSSVGDSRIFGYEMFSGSAESFSAVMEATPPPDYKLGPGDNVLVNVWGRVDMQLDLTIDRDGKVFIPKVGEVVGRGLTLDSFKERMDKAFSKSYSGYQLSVTLGKIRRIKIFIYGEVKRPGGYTTSSLSTLFNALYLAGGPSDTGSLRKIKHIRNNKVIREIDLYQFLLHGDNSQDAELSSGDVVFVPVVGPRVTISGEVKRSAAYEILGGEKLHDLIELAGGSTAEAFLEKVELDRISLDDSRIIKNIDLLNGYDPATDDMVTLRDGDIVKIPSLFDRRKNTVTITGQVKHPGRFGLTGSMRVSDLIDGGEQVLADAFLDRANLFRTWPDLSREILTVDISDILNGGDSTNYLLEELDSLVIYSQEQIKRDLKVSINGPVKSPGEYEYFQNMRLSDLIFLAGNPLKQSYLLRAEIARLNPGRPADMLYANLEAVLQNRGGETDILLHEDDIVYLREIPGWRVGENVTIEGEVEFPGKYSIIDEDERLTDLIERAGGCTSDAFIDGLVFVRGSISEHIERGELRAILASTEETLLDSLNRPIPKLNTDLDLGRVDRIIIDTKRLIRDENCPDNIVLRQGDYVFIPPVPSGIQVIGAVASSGTITFQKRKNARHYINEAGGFTNNANNKELRLVKANGRIFSGKKCFNRTVEPGDMVIVPYKLKRDNYWMRSTASVAGILASLATTILIIDRF